MFYPVYPVYLVHNSIQLHRSHSHVHLVSILQTVQLELHQMWPCCLTLLDMGGGLQELLQPTHVKSTKKYIMSSRVNCSLSFSGGVDECKPRTCSNLWNLLQCQIKRTRVNRILVLRDYK